MPQKTVAVLVAKPGAGKGTMTPVVAELLGHQTEIVTTSQIFHQLQHTHPDDHREVEAIKASGHLVPDELTNRLVAEHLDTISQQSHLILDGFPRSGEQVMALWPMLKKRGVYPGRVVVLELNVSDKECSRRAQIRMEEALTLKKDPRLDDDPKVVKKRLELFRDSYKAIIGPLSVSGAQCLRVDATGPKSEVAAAIREAWPFRDAVAI